MEIGLGVFGLVPDTKPMSVLILVLVEIGLGESSRCSQWRLYVSVLILVLVEIGLGEQKMVRS